MLQSLQVGLSDTVVVKTVQETETSGVFEIEGLYNGYGLTVGTALRRVLFSSIPGAAITQIKIKNASHEFTTIPGVLEDVVELMLNFKKVRLRLHTDEPQTLLLKRKGEGPVTAAEIKVNAQVDIVNPDIHLAALTEKNAELEVELLAERGLGYVPADTRKSEKLPIGVVALDALFSPVVKVHFVVEHMRVGERTDYNRLRLTIDTDGSATPSQVFQYASQLLREHFLKLSGVDVKKIEVKESASSGAKPKAKRSKKGAGAKSESEVE